MVIFQFAMWLFTRGYSYWSRLMIDSPTTYTCLHMYRWWNSKKECPFNQKIPQTKPCLTLGYLAGDVTLQSPWFQGRLFPRKLTCGRLPEGNLFCTVGHQKIPWPKMAPGPFRFEKNPPRPPGGSPSPWRIRDLTVGTKERCAFPTGVT